MKILLAPILFIMSILGECFLFITAHWYKTQCFLLKAYREYHKDYNIPIEAYGIRFKSVECGRYSYAALNNYTAQGIGLLERKDYYEVSLRIPFSDKSKAWKCKSMRRDRFAKDEFIAQMKDDGNLFQ